MGDHDCSLHLKINGISDQTNGCVCCPGYKIYIPLLARHTQPLDLRLNKLIMTERVPQISVADRRWSTRLAIPTYGNIIGREAFVAYYQPVCQLAMLTDDPTSGRMEISGGKSVLIFMCIASIKHNLSSKDMG